MADAEPEAAAGSGKENAGTQQQRELLREQVFRRILSSGALNSAKAHLRAQLYAELKSSCAGGPWQGHQPTHTPSLQHHVLNCLVAELLLSRQYKYTLSVFLAETGSSALPQLEHADILRLVGVVPDSKVYKLLARSLGTSHSSSAGASADTQTCAAGSSCLAEGMLAVLGSLGGLVNARDAGSQTCECQDINGGTASHGGGNTVAIAGGTAAAAPSSQLMQRLQQIEEEYKRKSTQLGQQAAQTLEERMAAYQRECDARCAAQLQERLASLRTTELAAVREQEASRQHVVVEEERRGLQQAHQERLAKLNKQEEELLERSRRLHREHEQLQQEHLRRVQAEEERQQAWRAESEAKLAAGQAAVKQQADAVEAAQRQLELRQQEAEQRLQARLAEVQQKEQAAVKQQLAAEAQLAQLAGLHSQLAAAMEEQGSLRQQLAAARAAAQAKQAAARQEADALRHENSRLAAAAAVSQQQPGLTPRDAARLQQAVRRLMQRVEELQCEVKACREREQLWKNSATEADKLLTKGTKAQDSALQACEDLRMTLTAACREVGDLQEQAALAAIGLEGPLASALQVVSRDAQRWQDGVACKLAAAKQAEEEARREAGQLRQRALANRTATAQALQQVLAAYLRDRQQQQQQAVDAEDQEELSSPISVAKAAQPPRPVATAPIAQPLLPTGAAVGVKQPFQEEPPPPLPQHLVQQQPSSNLLQGGSGGASNAIKQTPQQRPAPIPVQQVAKSVAHPPEHLTCAAKQPETSPSGAAKPPSRTASDILAAYRARQQRSANGGSSIAAALTRSRSTSLSQEASASPSAASQSSSSGASHDQGSQGDEVQGEPSTLEQPSVSEGGAAAGAGGIQVDADGYFTADLTSEDSSRF